MDKAFRSSREFLRSAHEAGMRENGGRPWIGRAGIRAESRMSPIVGPVLIRQRTIRGPLSKQFRGLGMQDCNIVIIEIESPFARFERYAKKLWNCATLKYHARRRVFLTTVEKMVNTKILWIGLEISCRPHDVGWLF